MDITLTIVFQPAEEGGFTAFIPEIPGVFSQGETIEETRDMVLDALKELSAYRRDEALEECKDATTETINLRELPAAS